MNRGGKREGAGRPQGSKKETSGKPVKFYLYPDEVEKMREYLKKLRVNRKEINR